MLARMIGWSAVAVAAIVVFSDRPVHAGKRPPEPTYTHRQCWLGTDDTVFGSWGYGLNIQGDVVGHAYWRTDDKGGWIGEAFICKNGPTRTIVNLNNVVEVPNPEAYLLEAYDINDSGQIVGVLSWNGTYAYAYRYTPYSEGDKLEVLGTIGLAPDISIDQYTRINNRGDMLVYSDLRQVACIYTYDTRKYLPIERPDGLRMGTRDMNYLRQVAGFFPTGLYPSPHTPVRFTPPDVFTTFGWLKSPGKSPSGMAQGINDYGVVTGYMRTLGGGVIHAFRYDESKQPDKRLEDLGGLGSWSTSGQSINSAGDVVGDATAFGELGTAFVHLNGRGNFDLKLSTQGLPAERTQWVMTAGRINEQGLILGRIGPYAYLLGPLP